MYGINYSSFDIYIKRKREQRNKRNKEELNKWYEQLISRHKDKSEVLSAPIRLQT